MKLSIALGSGGSRGLSSIGVLSVLEREGIRPAMISGSSMGAVIGAYYGVHGTIRGLREWYEKQKIKDYLSYTKKGNFKYSLIKTNKLESLLRRFLNNKNFKDTVIPIKIITTNLRTGKKVFTKGDLTKAVMASSALLGVMPPYKINGDYYVDGGVVSMTPIELLPKNHYRLGIDFSIIPKKNMGMPTMVESFRLASSIARRSVDPNKLPKNVEYIKPCPDKVASTIRFDKAKFYINLGEIAGEKLIKRWKRNGIYKKLKDDVKNNKKQNKKKRIKKLGKNILKKQKEN